MSMWGEVESDWLGDNAELRKRIAALEAENARLANALEDIADDAYADVIGIQDFARSALKAWREVTDQPQE